MRKASTYIVSVFLTLLLIFLMIAAGLAWVVRFRALDTATAVSVVSSENLAARVHTALETAARQ